MYTVMVLSALVLRSLPATPAVMCRCTEPKSTRAAYRAARAVVIAKVTEVRRGVDGFTAVLVVSLAWKKDVPTRLVIVSATSCSYDLQVDREYLLYLVHDIKMLEGKDDQTYTTGICLGNKPLAEATKALRWLRGYGRATAVQPAP